MRTLLCGDQDPVFTREEILKYTEPKLGYTKESPGFLKFVNVLVELTGAERKAFLQVCGTFGGKSHLCHSNTTHPKILSSLLAAPLFLLVALPTSTQGLPSRLFNINHFSESI